MSNNIFDFLKESFRLKSNLLSQNSAENAHSPLINLKIIKKFVNFDIRTIEGTLSLENAFFWEFYSEDLK